MDLTTIINFLKLPKIIFLIAIITTILLFSSQTFMETIALYKFKEEYTVWIGIVFLFTAGLSLIHLIEYLQEIYNSKKKKKEELKLFKIHQKEYQNILESLDNDELINIREFYLQKKNTIQMISNNSAVAGLIKKV